MKEIRLTRGMVALVDDRDYGMLSRYTWHSRKGSRPGMFYAARVERWSTGMKVFYMHRSILLPSASMEVLHIDGNGLNNTRSNLIEVTHKEGMRNQERYSPGRVRFCAEQTSRPWVANYRGVRVGSFVTEGEAEAEILRIEQGGTKTNLRSSKTSSCNGVRLRKDGFWQAYYGRDHLGLFKSEAEAIDSRKAEEMSRGKISTVKEEPAYDPPVKEEEKKERGEVRPEKGAVGFGLWRKGRVNRSKSPYITKNIE